PPFYAVLNANLNLNLFGVIDAPFKFTYSPQQNDFNYPFQHLQPFNQMGISPKYKGYTTHIGYGSLHMSKYTFSGNKFLGGGFEIANNGSKWRYAGFYGRLAKAARDTTYINVPGLNAYDRWGMGVKTRYGNNKNNVELILFKAWDNKESINIPLQYASNFPQENLIVGVVTKKQISDKIVFNAEYAYSVFTRNTNNEEIVLQSYTYANNLGPLYTPRESSQFNGAINTDIAYKAKLYQLKLAYKKIGPEYVSLGIPFINNDVANYTANLSWRMFKKKMNISTSGGFEKNNLNNTKLEENRRLISNVNVQYAVSKKLNLMGAFSNFNTSVIRTTILQLDSLNYYQITKNASFGANYRITSKSKDIHVVLLNSSYQEANDVQNQGSLIYNGNLGYTFNRAKKGFSTSVMLNVNANSFTGLKNIGFGPTVAVNKSLLKKKLNASFIFNQLNFTNAGEVADKTNNARLSFNYNLKKGHKLGLTAAYIDKENQSKNQSYKEFTGTFNYAYNFSK
ncbi:MAG: hypothetical protein IH948_00855, partial [Bacteroidetes bacterium]|nr:hypothetical protein [Bacteroidota bacterium]